MSLAWLAERERALQWARHVAATPGLLSRTGLPLQAGGVFLLLTQPCHRLRLQVHKSDNRGGRWRRVTAGVWGGNRCPETEG